MFLITEKSSLLKSSLKLCDIINHTILKRIIQNIGILHFYINTEFSFIKNSLRHSFTFSTIIKHINIILNKKCEFRFYNNNLVLTKFYKMFFVEL